MSNIVGINENLNKKITLSKKMDFLTKLGSVHFTTYKKSIENSEDVKDLDHYSFVAGSSIFNEILLDNKDSKFFDKLKSDLQVKLLPYKEHKERYQAMINYFMVQANIQLQNSPMYKDLDNTSFLSGFVFAATNIFKGLCNYQSGKTDEFYKYFINLANEKIYRG